MTVLLTAVQFTVSCLALGMGMFLAAEAAREMSRVRIASAAGTPALVALGGAALLMAGLYGALLSVPL
ncbi:MAG: hypothetical protein HY874_02615 [Chloroflexi bacterium]|nr:hypothetical protein [Chloroflexota bacterium]